MASKRFRPFHDRGRRHDDRVDTRFVERLQVVAQTIKIFIVRQQIHRHVDFGLVSVGEAHEFGDVVLPSVSVRPLRRTS